MTQKERIQSALVISHCPVPKIGWLSTVCRSTFLSLTERKGLVMANREPRIFNYHIETPWKPKRDASACPEIHCRPQWICRLRQGCFPPLCSGPGPFSCFFINQRRQVLPPISSRSRIRGWPGEPFSLFKYGLNHSSSTLPPTLHIAPLSGPLFLFISPFPLFLRNALVLLRHPWLPSPAFSTCRQVSRIPTPSSSCRSCSFYPSSQQYWNDWTVKFRIDGFLYWAIIP